MIRVSNKTCIRRLSWKTMGASKTRNLIAVLAIVLTTVLFTSLFTIALSINEGFQQSNFRQAGGYSHGSFKYLTKEQFETLREDPLIKETGLRRFLGMPEEAPFHKAHVEVGYSDANSAHWMYCDPVEGRLPQEGTNEAATDTQVLELLGIAPKLGETFTLTFLVDGRETTQTFTLCGWWEYDAAIVANHVLLPQSRLDAILQEVGVTPPGADGMTGSWNLNVMLDSSLHIEQDMQEILTNHGYQNQERDQKDSFVATGVNWGYTGAKLAENMDPLTVLVLGGMLLLIVITGYLIIYNVFQISVTNDIRFYGLLKTIGTTGRQIKTLLRQQALLLSFVSIPIGLFLGWLVGGQLTPMVIHRLNGVRSVVSVRPAIFVGAALFALFTVLLSCAKPGKMAAKVSPIEALRYTEGSGITRKGKKSRKVTACSMAWANLSRSKGKTVITILSLSLAVVLTTMTVTFTQGFDMDKYLAGRSCSDFVVADGKHFQTGGELFNPEMELPQEVIDEIKAQGGITEGGRVYGKTTPVLESVTEEWFSQNNNRWYTTEQLKEKIAAMERDEAGLLFDGAQLYGMEPFALDRLNVVEGDLSKLYEPGGHAIAAVVNTDDYGKAERDSHWARLGDTITLRYVDAYEYYDPATGEIFGSEPPATKEYASRAAAYREVDYEVVALVAIPTSLDYGYYGDDGFVLNDQTFCTETKSDSVMLYAFDTEKERTQEMENFLIDYTEKERPMYDYVSKATYQGEFEGFRSMFLILGGALSFIVGLVGVLNFFNAIFMGILTRRREFAVLQSIGMTGWQLKAMLVWEGLFYALGAIFLSLGLTLVLGPLSASSLERLFWFFTYRLTIMPILILLPIFLLLGCFIPLVVSWRVSRQSLIERLRQGET